MEALWHCASAKDCEKWAIDILLRYDPEDGNLYWNPRPLDCFKDLRSQCYWNSVYGGKVAGAKNYFGKKSDLQRAPLCILVTFTDPFGLVGVKRHTAHRLIWATTYGSIDGELVIDHKDRNPFNNRLENIRLCTQQDNSRNKGKRNAGVNEYIGVSFHKPTQKWCATCGGEWLGVFSTPEEAAKVRDAVARTKHGEFAVLNFP